MKERTYGWYPAVKDIYTTNRSIYTPYQEECLYKFKDTMYHTKLIQPASPTLRVRGVTPSTNPSREQLYLMKSMLKSSKGKSVPKFKLIPKLNLPTPLQCWGTQLSETPYTAAPPAENPLVEHSSGSSPVITWPIPQATSAFKPMSQTPSTCRPASHTPSTCRPASHTPSTCRPASHTPSTCRPASHTPSTCRPASHTPSTCRPASQASQVLRISGDAANISRSNPQASRPASRASHVPRPAPQTARPSRPHSEASNASRPVIQSARMARPSSEISDANWPLPKPPATPKPASETQEFHKNTHCSPKPYQHLEESKKVTTQEYREPTTESVINAPTERVKSGLAERNAKSAGSSRISKTPIPDASIRSERNAKSAGPSRNLKTPEPETSSRSERNAKSAGPSRNLKTPEPETSSRSERNAKSAGPYRSAKTPTPENSLRPAPPGSSTRFTTPVETCRDDNVSLREEAVTTPLNINEGCDEKLDFEEAREKYGWYAEIHGDPLGLKKLPKRPQYFVTCEKPVVPPDAPAAHMENTETFFYNTIPRNPGAFSVDKEWMSEVLLAKRLELQKKEGINYSWKHFGFVY